MKRTKETALWTLMILFGLSLTARAAELPDFRPGLWQFDRTVEDPAVPGGPQKLQAQKCVDPKADMQKQNQMLKQLGCILTPLTQTGQVYHFKASCKFPNGGHGRSVTD